MNLPVFLTTVPILSLENLYYLEVSSAVEEEERLIFFFDDEELWREMHELFQRLQEDKRALVKEPALTYTEVEELSELPKDRPAFVFGEGDLFYCVKLYNVSPFAEEEFLVCFGDRDFANWFASIVDRAMELRLRKFGVG